jgi:hypothetical protein
MAWLLGALILGGSPVAVQAQAVPDSAAVARYQALLVGLRDAVDRVSARANEFRRDLKTIGETTVLSRATRLDETCRATRTALAEARPQLAAARLAPHQASARDTLVTVIGRLTASLQQDCERGLGPAGPGSRADTLRAWGPHRTATLSQAVTAYHGAAARLARRLGADITQR